MSNEAEIVIAGGGIGGLTTAIGLAAHGIESTVLEQAPELRASGSGITLQTNAMVVMRTLGLEDALRDAGSNITGGSVLDRSGRVLQEMSLTREPAGVAIHRERLLRCLADACPAEVRYDRRIVGYSQADGRVSVQLESGALDARALIACDGLHSDVRRSMHGEQPLRYAGYTTWRGICRDVPVDVPGTSEVWGAGTRFGIVPIGHGEVYWFAVADAKPGGADGDSPTKELLAIFGDWVAPVPALLTATRDEDVLRTDTFDRAPITRWIDGNVALLGDAAHPMTPNLGQGAGQAIEDALALARAMDRHSGDVAAAFRAYEACRVDRANWVVKQSWQMGKMAHVPTPFLRAARNLAMRLTPAAVVHKSVDRLYSPRIEPG